MLARNDPIETGRWRTKRSRREKASSPDPWDATGEVAEPAASLQTHVVDSRLNRLLPSFIAPNDDTCVKARLKRHATETDRFKKRFI